MLLSRSGSSGDTWADRNRTPAIGLGDRLDFGSIFSGRSGTSWDSSEFCFKIPDIRRSCRAFISASTVPVTPIPPIFEGGVARLDAAESSLSICFKSDSDSDLDLPADFRFSASGNSLEKELRRDLATGDLAGGGDTPSPVGEGLGFFPNIEESSLTPIPLLSNSNPLKPNLLKRGKLLQYLLVFVPVAFVRFAGWHEIIFALLLLFWFILVLVDGQLFSATASFIAVFLTGGWAVHRATFSRHTFQGRRAQFSATHATQTAADPAAT